MSFLDTGYICTSLEIRPFELGGNLSFFTLFSLIQFGGLIKNLLVFCWKMCRFFFFFLTFEQSQTKASFFLLYELKSYVSKEEGNTLELCFKIQLYCFLQKIEPVSFFG